MEHTLDQLIQAASEIRQDTGLVIVVIGSSAVTLDEVLEVFIQLAREKQCSTTSIPE